MCVDFDLVLRPIAIVRCVMRSIASVNNRHHHNLTVIIELEQVNLRIPAKITTVQTRGQQWSVVLTFWTSVLQLRQQYCFQVNFTSFHSLHQGLAGCFHPLHQGLLWSATMSSTEHNQHPSMTSVVSHEPQACAPPESRLPQWNANVKVLFH